MQKKFFAVLLISVLSTMVLACGSYPEGDIANEEDSPGIIKDDGYGDGKADALGVPKKIGLRGGHSANCTGAVGLVREYDEMQKFYSALKAVLEKYGHQVVNANSNASTAYNELREGAVLANDAKVNLFVSLHMNAGGGVGSEAWVYPNSRAASIAQKMVNNLAGLGLRNRGVKSTAEYFEMKNVVAPNIILETLFLDSQGDTNLWKSAGLNKFVHAVGNAINPAIPLNP